MKFDMHVHSQYSDGALSLEQLCLLSNEAGLDGFALTDHDTVKGWQDIAACAEKYGTIILPAVEISTETDNKDVHILAYNLPQKIPHVQVLLAKLKQSRVERAQAMVAKLQSLGFAISFYEVAELAGQASLCRPHIAGVLLQKGYGKSEQEIFKRFIGRDCPAYVPRPKLTPEHCLEVILQDGGLPVLAHPGIDEVDCYIPHLKNLGLWGVEVFHSAHSISKEEKLCALAKKYQLVMTAGSDFHKPVDDAHGNLGQKYMEITNLKALFSNYHDGG